MLLPIRQVIEGGCEIIKTREDGELAELDRQINELMAKRNQIRTQPVQVETNNKKREIKALINPKNTTQKYTVGIRPKWLEDWLKETLVIKSATRERFMNRLLNGRMNRNKHQ